MQNVIENINSTFNTKNKPECVCTAFNELISHKDMFLKIDATSIII